MQLLGIHHAAIISSNYARSKAFYSNILGLKTITETYRAPRQSYKLDLVVPDGTKIELFSFPSPPNRVNQPEAAGLRHLAFRVADLDSAIAELESKGVPVEPVRIDQLTGKRFTFFADPDGLPLELCEE